MPKEVFDKHYAFLPQSSLLSFEEITRLARAVRRARRAQDPPDRRRAAAAQATSRAGRRCWPSCARADGEPLDLTLTTNGSLLARKAAGAEGRPACSRVTVSLDALDDAIFRRMNDADFPVADVLRRHRRRASAPGLGPIKVNMVVKRGTNDHEIVPMARHFRGTRRRAALHRVHGRRRDQRLAHGRGAAVGRGGRAHRTTAFALEPLAAERAGETAERWRYARRRAARSASISSVTQAFCRDCNRARLSTEGKLFLCLFASRGHDLRALLRGGASDAQIAAAIGLIWQQRDDRYSELRSAAPGRARRGERRVEMHYIGG